MTRAEIWKIILRLIKFTPDFLTSIHISMAKDNFMAMLNFKDHREV